MVDGFGARGGDERQRGEERNRVAVHRAGEAAEPVPAEAPAPVDVRLEQRERRRGRDDKDGVPAAEPERPQSRRRDDDRPLERQPLADGEDRQSQRCSRDRRREPERPERDDHEPRAADRALQLERELARRGRKRVREHACGEHDEGSGAAPGSRADEHATPRPSA